ncbi:hypothetical protein AMECASPLE_018980 [Ameca splendens]|uniref:Uncharacterized protein n=1 Tax=Ameca splendens TaxID=208324 RepID=A0ABV0XRV6_9TELE
MLLSRCKIKQIFIARQQTAKAHAFIQHITNLSVLQFNSFVKTLSDSYSLIIFAALKKWFRHSVPSLCCKKKLVSVFGVAPNMQPGIRNQALKDKGYLCGSFSSYY